jgi:HTH-type transcriptional regulator / antitoxin HipB
MIIIRTSTQLGDAVRRARRKKRLSQTELAAVIGVRQATVSSLENGNGGTSLEIALSALSALDVEITIAARKAGPDIEDIF